MHSIIKNISEALAILFFSGASASSANSEFEKIRFTENKGQIHDQTGRYKSDILFNGTTGNMDFHLRNDGVSYQLKKINTWKNYPFNENNLSGSQIIPANLTIYR